MTEGDGVQVKHTLKTHEGLRLDAAKWLLRNDIRLVCCEGTELAESFLNEYTLPEAEEELIETLVNENDEITLIFQSRIYLPANRSVSGRGCSFIILRYVRALYDDFGNIYRYLTLGYRYDG